MAIIDLTVVHFLQLQLRKVMSEKREFYGKVFIFDTMKNKTGVKKDEIDLLWHWYQSVGNRVQVFIGWIITEVWPPISTEYDKTIGIMETDYTGYDQHEINKKNSWRLKILD